MCRLACGTKAPTKWDERDQLTHAFVAKIGSVILPSSNMCISLYHFDTEGTKQAYLLGLNSQLPSAEQIRDRIESDGLLEAIGVVLALYLVAQCIARARRGAGMTSPFLPTI